MKMILVVLLVLSAASCTSSKSNVPDTDSFDSDNYSISDSDFSKIDENTDETIDNDNNDFTGDNSEPDDKSDQETPDEDTGPCAYDSCEINGKCYDNGATDPEHLCNVCDVEKNRSDWTPATSGTICRISSGECDIAEKCDGINADCPEDVFKPVEAPCGDKTDSDCRNPDSCDGYGLCIHNYEPEFTLCTNDHNLCNGTEKCNSQGQCIPQGPEIDCGVNECNPSTGTCGCDSNEGYYPSPYGIYCFMAGKNVPPTEQNKCFDSTDEIPCPPFNGAYFGQDANYEDNSRTFTVTGDSPDRVVTDSFSGLTWEIDYNSTKMTYPDALTHCASKGDGWRIPSVKELASTLNFNYSNPVCDTNYCPDNSEHFWTSTENPDNTSENFLVYFLTSHIRTYNKTETHNIRCVKGDVFNSDGTFTSDNDSSEPVTTDDKTGLSWTKTINRKPWADALEGCESLSYGGYADWRLPNYQELLTAVKYSSSESATDISGTVEAEHWTSTTYAEVNTSALFFSFSNRNAGMMTKTSSLFYICVR